MRITSKGQVTIPQEIRDKFGLLPNTEVAFQVAGGTVRLVKAAGRAGYSRGATAVARMRGRADIRMSTDEIMALTRGPIES